MIVAVHYRANTASTVQIAEHLLCCDPDFVPKLSERVDIPDYAEKIVNKATRFEAWSNGTLVGLVALLQRPRGAQCSHHQRERGEGMDG